MIITLTRSGGFTGIPQKKIVDTKKLPPEKAKKIEDLVSQSHLLRPQEGQPQGIAPTKRTPDRFTYTINLENDTFSRMASIPEESLTLEMHALITCLQSA